MPNWKEEWEGDMEAAVTTLSADTKSEIRAGLKVGEGRTVHPPEMFCSRELRYFQRDEDMGQMLPGELCSPSGGGGSRGCGVPGALPEGCASLRAGHGSAAGH